MNCPFQKKEYPRNEWQLSVASSSSSSSLGMQPAWRARFIPWTSQGQSITNASTFSSDLTLLFGMGYAVYKLVG